MNDREQLEADIRRTMRAIKRAKANAVNDVAMTRLLHQREALARMKSFDSKPAWCEIHQHYAWCEHNRGVKGPTGYEATRPNSQRGDEHEEKSGRV